MTYGCIAYFPSPYHTIAAPFVVIIRLTRAVDGYVNGTRQGV